MSVDADASQCLYQDTALWIVEVSPLVISNIDPSLPSEPFQGSIYVFPSISMVQQI